MNLIPYTQFERNETIAYGSAATSASANHAPLFIKKELNNLYNYIQLKFSENPFDWDAALEYEIGDVVYSNGICYIATAYNINAEPPGAQWSVLPQTGVTFDSISGTTANFDNISGTTATYTNFIGTASQAKYADIAEKYAPDAKYLPSVVLGIGGDKEVTLYKKGMKVAGVVSTNPGYMMNYDLENGVYVALKGRVPCSIVGIALKGQYIVAYNDGKGKAQDEITFEDSKKLLGIALSDSVNNIVEIKI